jgi:hypothetical protein
MNTLFLQDSQSKPSSNVIGFNDTNDCNSADMSLQVTMMTEGLRFPLGVPSVFLPHTSLAEVTVWRPFVSGFADTERGPLRLHFSDC